MVTKEYAPSVDLKFQIMANGTVNNNTNKGNGSFLMSLIFNKGNKNKIAKPINPTTAMCQCDSMTKRGMSANNSNGPSPL